MAIYDLLYRTAVYPGNQLRTGQRVRARLRELKGELGQSAECIGQRQIELLRRTLQHANEQCPFWKKRFDECGMDIARVKSIDDLATLPVLTKTQVREHLETVSAANFATTRIVATTGGSTAAPMRFYRDRGCRDFRDAVRADYWEHIGKGFYDRWVNVWGAMMDLGDVSTARNRLRSRLLRRALIIPANRIDENSIGRFAEEMNSFKPTLLHGYSQALYLVARLVQQSNLQLPKSLVAVTATAEPLYENQKQLIQDVLDLPVFRVYGTREFGFIGGELPAKNGLQINPLNVIVEILDEQAQPVTGNARGQIVVTDLQNRATPLIRYQIGDVGSWHQQQLCHDSWQSIQIDAGRETDFIVGPDGRLIGGAGLTLISSPGIRQLQFLQKKSGHLIVNYVGTECLQKQELDLIRNQLHAVVGNLTVEFNCCDQISPTKSGKFQYVYSELSREMLGLASSDGGLK